MPFKTSMAMGALFLKMNYKNHMNLSETGSAFSVQVGVRDRADHARKRKYIV